jgi:hypothetical protein
MTRCRTVASAFVAALAVFSPGIAHAELPMPQLEAPCPADLAGTMTLLPDEQTYVVCQDEIGARFAWTPAPTPFEPNDQWLSYGPMITLHGQGMRNPNLTSGQWTATPQDSETVCRAQQETVIEAGVLSEPQVSQGITGQSLSLEMLPKLFYAELSGNCLWVKD